MHLGILGLLDVGLNALLPSTLAYICVPLHVCVYLCLQEDAWSHHFDVLDILIEVGHHLLALPDLLRESIAIYHEFHAMLHDQDS